MLDVKHLHKSIDRRPVLRDISFSLEPGRVVGLVGRNGAGKTTLLKTMAGILIPDAGTVEYEGASIHETPSRKQNIVFVPDAPEALHGYTPAESAEFMALVYPKFDAAYFKNAMERFGLPEHRSIRQFSKGMKMMVSILLGLATKAPYVLLDEPTNGIDPVAKKQVLSLLMDAAGEGTTLLISSHLMDELERITDTLLLMKDGSIETHATDSPADGKIRKFQIAFQGDAPEDWLALPGVHVLEHIGRVYTVLIEETAPEAMQRLRDSEPLLLEPLPLKIEDVFMWKLGGIRDVE